MTIVTNEEELNEIQQQLLKRKYNNIDIDSNVVEGDEKEKIIEAIEKRDINEGFFKKGIDITSNFFSGNDRTEFPKMEEYGSVKLKSIANEIKIGTGMMITPSIEAQVDMIKNTYPNAIISKDKFDNIVITMPADKVKEGTNRTFYLNKPGFTTKDFVEGVGQMLMYIPGAGWVYKKVGGGIIKKGMAQSAAAGTTGVVQDTAAMGFGSQQGEKGIPIVEDDRLALNLGLGFAGEAVGNFLSRFTGFNYVKDGINKIVPSKFNIFSGSGMYLNNKGIVTNKAKEIAKKHFDDVSLVNDKKVMKEYAQALEDGINPTDAVHIVGANEFGISLWKAQASGNKKILKYIDEARKGVHGEQLKNIIQFQDERQLTQTFNYLTKFRNNLIRNKNTQQSTTLPGQKTQVEETIDNITNQIKSVKQKMDDIVDDKYNAINWNGKIKLPVVKNLESNIKNAIKSSDGLGQPINNITMPNSTAALKNISTFVKELENLDVNKISVITLENQRRLLNKILQTTNDATDKKALMVIKGEFDKFYDKTIQGALSSGNKKILKEIKDARAYASSVKKIFEPNNIGKNKDLAGAYINNILNGKYSALQINNYLYGNASLSANSVKQSEDILKRLTSTIFKPGTEGFDLLVDGAAQRMINNSFKQVGNRQIFDPKLFIKEVETMINGNGKNISNILFTKDQQKEILSFANQLQKTTNINDFKQIDKGTKKFIDVYKSFVRSLAGIFGFQVAGIQGTLTTRFFVDAITDTAKHNKAIEEITQAIAFSKLPNASGGQGLVQTAYQNQNFVKPINTRDDASTLEQLQIIENLNKYR